MTQQQPVPAPVVNPVVERIMGRSRMTQTEVVLTFLLIAVGVAHLFGFGQQIDISKGFDSPELVAIAAIVEKVITLVTIVFLGARYGDWRTQIKAVFLKLLAEAEANHAREAAAQRNSGTLAGPSNPNRNQNVPNGGRR